MCKHENNTYSTLYTIKKPTSKYSNYRPSNDWKNKFEKEFVSLQLRCMPCSVLDENDLHIFLF